MKIEIKETDKKLKYMRNIILLKIIPSMSKIIYQKLYRVPSPSVACKSLTLTLLLFLLLLCVNSGLCMALESCLGQFDVHKNTIIRTGESQALGGKYLEGVELDTIEECQRLCCETESCDVYIFEAKNDGFCYLFECGSPENFHCKFTRHANYTSAVLTKPRELSNVAVTTTTLKPYASNVSQQEFELTSLKAKQQEAVVLHSNLKQVEASGHMATDKAQGVKSTQNTVKTNESKCGRFQFACHSGECIAVYNACDGIPQCLDGSDEGPECSGAPSSSQSVLLTNNNKKLTTPDVVPDIPRPIPQPIDNREDHNAWSNRQIVAELQQQAGSKSKNYDNINQNEEYSQKVKAIVEEVTSLPHSIQVQPLYPGPQVPGAVPNVGYNAGQDQILLQSNKNWEVQPNSNTGRKKENPMHSQNNGFGVNTHANVVPQLNTINTNSGQIQPQQNIVISQETVIEPISNKIHAEHKPKNIIPENQESYEDSVEKSTEPPKKKQHKHKKPKTKFADHLEDEVQEPEKPLPQPKMKITTSHEPTLPVVHEQYKAIHDSLALEFRDHDGFSERPGGAMLSLTLGLLVTVSLGILVACRFRTVRRRSRRPGGKSSYAQESDFLVNGMYL